MAFHSSGAHVELAAPSAHPALLTSSVAVHHQFRALRPLHSLLAAIRASRPDLIVPTDDTVTAYLHQLYAKAPEMDAALAPYLRSLLARSLGDPASFPILASRVALLSVAQQQGILTPATAFLPDQSSLHAWLAQHPLPAVLKVDGTSGGEGVEIVYTKKQALRAWHKLRAPLGFARVIKKTGFEHDPHHIVPWITRRPRRVSIQEFIEGRDANIAVACWQGEVLGAITMDVLHNWRPKGPSALVELTRSDAMLDATRALVRRLRLSGLCGFDFMVKHPSEGSSSNDSAAAPPYLIELNPRATQTCHLPYGVPRDLIESLLAALAQRPLPALNEARRRGIVSLFPLAWQSGISKEVLDSTLKDVPWDEPLLVKAGFALPNESFYEKCRNLWRRATTPRPLPGEIE
jgi:hypothetical protein